MFHWPYPQQRQGLVDAQSVESYCKRTLGRRRNQPSPESNSSPRHGFHALSTIVQNNCPYPPPTPLRRHFTPARFGTYLAPNSNWRSPHPPASARMIPRSLRNRETLR